MVLQLLVIVMVDLGPHCHVRLVSWGSQADDLVSWCIDVGGTQR